MYSLQLSVEANLETTSMASASLLSFVAQLKSSTQHPFSNLESINNSTQIGHSGSQIAVRTISHCTSARTTPPSSILPTSLPDSRPASTEYAQQPSSNTVVQNRIDAHQTTQHVAIPISDEAQDNQNASSSIDLENNIAKNEKFYSH